MSTPIFAQDARPLRVTTPLGKDAFLLTGLSGSEGISQLFEFRLELLASTGTQVPFEKLLGQPVGFTVDLPDGSPRHFHGMVCRVGQGERELGPDDLTYTAYRVDVVPRVWLLTRSVRSRIFQQVGVPDVLKKVFAGLDVSFELKGTYEPRNYCAQYRESDFDFASRLMEEEGIFYFFKHDASGHTMVVGDTPASHPPVPGESTLRYDAERAGDPDAPRVFAWEKVQEVRSGKVTLRDHSFELPNNPLEASVAAQATVAAGSVSHPLKVADNDKLEVYDYPGEYAKRFDGTTPGGGARAADVQKILQDNARTAGIRMQQETAEGVRIRGVGEVRQLLGGHKFTLKGHPDADGEYVLTSVTHRAQLGRASRSGAGVTFDYANAFTCIPAALPYRPPRETPRPRVAGCQTAVVVGPSGEEIFTDRYGRVKIQLPWDREGQRNGDSSCWVRVSTPWAGAQWGMVAIPRVGSEVVVDFLEGDPDRPIVTGMVYNAEQMPPYALPDNKTQSGIKTRSTLSGDAQTFNELRFEDKKDAEQVYLHAERDLDAVVENNETRKVGFEKKEKGDQTVEVFNNQTTKIGSSEAEDGSQTVEVWKNQTVRVGKSGSDGSHTLEVHKDQTVTIETGNQALTVKQGNRSVTLDQGNETVAIKMGGRTVTLDQGNDSLTLKMGNLSTTVKMGSITEEAMQGIEMKVGQNSVKIDQSGVTIKGLNVKVEATVQAQVKGVVTQVSGDGMLQMKGGITMIN